MPKKFSNLLKSSKSPASAWLFTYRHYLFFATVLTIAFATMFGLIQQLNRMQANDTPALLATQVAKQLDADLGLNSINMGATDLANNPVPFVIVYDKQGKAVGGSGYIDQKLAVVPKGVLEHSSKGNDNAVTWEPKAGVRIASVTVAAKDYYVLGGQSLVQAESRINRLAVITLVGYAIALVAIAGYAVLPKFMKH